MGEWKTKETECQGPKVDRKLKNKKANGGDQKMRNEIRPGCLCLE